MLRRLCSKSAGTAGMQQKCIPAVPASDQAYCYDRNHKCMPDSVIDTALASRLDKLAAAGFACSNTLDNSSLLIPCDVCSQVMQQLGSAHAACACLAALVQGDLASVAASTQLPAASEQLQNGATDGQAAPDQQPAPAAALMPLQVRLLACSLPHCGRQPGMQPYQTVRHNSCLLVTKWTMPADTFAQTLQLDCPVQSAEHNEQYSQ